MTKETAKLRKYTVVTGPSSGFDNILGKGDSLPRTKLVCCVFPRKTKGLLNEIRY